MNLANDAELEMALMDLLDEVRERAPLTLDEIRTECIDFILNHHPDLDRDEVEAVYDGLYPLFGQTPG